MGHACVDITPTLDTSPGLEPGVLYPVGPLGFKLGGSAINTGRTLHELGSETTLAIATGDDSLALIYDNLLQKLGLPMHLVRTGLSTSYSIVVEHGRHDRTFWQHEGFNAAFDPRRVDLDVTSPDLIHAGYPSLMPFWCENTTALAEALGAAKQRDITTSLDLAHVGEGSVASTVDWHDWFATTLPHVDVMSPSWDDVASALGIQEAPEPAAMRRVAQRLIDLGAGIVQLSAGKAGFLIRTAGQDRLQSAGRTIRAVAAGWANQDLWFDAENIASPRTTVGAGDSLTAGLIHALGQAMPPQVAGEFARSVVGKHLRAEPRS